ncbi:hypothetical protein N7457_008076 [Penicillium paradoxum]|uniref:uncharacterized protein n=1 Tax=Penicillium paradoxum TaxID=176176 RepID=UPI002547D6FE|nr:uncharacterized protein N7457_008076 [Penicillium paradoxum]KAJ5773180.1 hypothetical protein N7457_008076 [Penicillium paradoxum]
MVRNTMPLPRIPDLSLPSFRELDESIEANRQNHPRPSGRFTNNVYEGRGNSLSPSPRTSTLPNPCPPYPVRGWHIPPDPSQNVCIHLSRPWDFLLTSRQAFRDRWFSSPTVRPHRRYIYKLVIITNDQKQDPAGAFRPEMRFAGNRDLPLPTSETLPLRPRVSKASPTDTQSTLSSAQRILRERMSSSSRTPSTPEVSPNPPRPALGDRNLPKPTLPAREPRDDPVPSGRVQRRRIGVTFSEVAAHTAKCDECNKRNRNGMSRCQTCGWQLCRKCQTDRNGDRTHGSIGATHVPEGGYTPLSPAANANETRRADFDEDVRAARTLLELGSFGNRTPSAAGSVKGNEALEMPATRSQFERPVDAVSPDSEMTLSIPEEGVWPQGGDDDVIPIGADGLPIGYVITRRNPVRAARPSTMAE